MPNGGTHRALFCLQVEAPPLLLGRGFARKTRVRSKNDVRKHALPPLVTSVFTVVSRAECCFGLPQRHPLFLPLLTVFGYTVVHRSSPPPCIVTPGKPSAPHGDVLSDVITEAVRLGDTFPASPSSLEAARLDKREGPPSSRVATAAEFIARAESAGWDTSVLFLEKTGAARLRLLHRGG